MAMIPNEESSQLLADYEHIKSHFHTTVTQVQSTHASIAWTVARLTFSSAFAIFGAWVFITPAIKAVTDSERVRQLLSQQSIRMIQALGRLAGVESFLSNCGVNFVCINNGLRNWSSALDDKAILYQEHEQSTRAWLVDSGSNGLKHFLTIAGVVPYYMLALDDDFVAQASTHIKHFYAFVITSSMYFVQLSGMNQVQESLTSKNFFMQTVRYPDDPQKRSACLIRKTQAAYFNEVLQYAETAGPAAFSFAAELIHLAVTPGSAEAIQQRWKNLCETHQFESDKEPYVQINTTIETLENAPGTPEVINAKQSVQLYLDVMYHLKAIINDRYPTAQRQVNPELSPLLSSTKTLPLTWYQQLWQYTLTALKLIAKFAFAYYAFNYLFSVIGYGLDAGYAMADRVSEPWQKLVFHSVNITSNLAFIGLCLPSLDDGWDVLCNLTVYYPKHVLQSFLSQLFPSYISQPTDDRYQPLEKQFHRGVYLLVTSLTVAACVFSGGTNARVNEENIPRFLNSLHVPSRLTNILDYHAWLFAWVSSAIMNAWYTLDVTTAGLGQLYRGFDQYQQQLKQKEALYQLVAEIGDYSISTTQNLIRPLLRDSYIEALENHGNIELAASFNQPLAAH